MRQIGIFLSCRTGKQVFP